MSDSEFRTTPTRRDAIRRGAVVGGALLWATPVVQSVGSAAFATDGSPKPGECVWYVMKIDPTDRKMCDDSKDSGNFDCAEGAPKFTEAKSGGCEFFEGLTENANGTWTVTLKPEVDASTVQAYSKCGSSLCQSVPVTDRTDGVTADKITFSLCSDGGKLKDISNVQLVFCVKDGVN